MNNKNKISKIITIFLVVYSCARIASDYNFFNTTIMRFLSHYNIEEITSFLGSICALVTISFLTYAVFKFFISKKHSDSRKESKDIIVLCIIILFTLTLVENMVSLMSEINMYYYFEYECCTFELFEI